LSGIAIILAVFLLVGFLSAGKGKRRRTAAGKSMRTTKAGHCTPARKHFNDHSPRKSDAVVI
jgi:hypothetical protein